MCCLVTDSVKAGSRQKPKTKDGCAIADWGEQDSDTRPGSWVTPLLPFPRMRIRTYKGHNNPPQEAKQRHLVENGAVTLSPAQLGQPRSSGTRLSTYLFYGLEALHSLTSRGKRSNLSLISVCSLVHLFNFLPFFFFFSFFSFSFFFFLNTEKEKIHFYFQLLLKIFFLGRLGGSVG